MRRRPSRVASVAAAVLGIAIARGAAAQSGVVGEGAPDLLYPVGARAVAMGQATVADGPAAGALWWNPALIATASIRQVGFDYAKPLEFVSDNILNAVVPIRGVGSVALSARYIDLGQQEATDDQTGEVTGLLSVRTTMVGATFGAPIGPVAVGLSFRLYRQGYDCSGECRPGVESANTSTLDAGARYATHLGGHALSIGAAVRNLGRALQVKDAPQADPLPGRIDIGMAVQPAIRGLHADYQVRVAASVVGRLGEFAPGYRIGSELDVRQAFQLRGGYVIDGPTGSGPSFGVGVRTGRLQIDVTRFMSDFASGSATPPSYVSLRWDF